MLSQMPKKWRRGMGYSESSNRADKNRNAYKKTTAHHVRMSRLSSIDEEILKCQRMLGVIDGDRGYIGSDLQFIPVSVTQTGLKSNSDHGMTSFKPIGYPTNLDVFNDMLNCNNQPIYRSIGEEYEHGNNTYKHVVFRSESKGKLEISARCVFQAIDQETGEGKERGVFWYPLAYLFTTNDPLNMDNFNYFNHGQTYNQKKCVEQLAFCEDKLKIGIHCINKTEDEAFKAAILAMADSIGTDKFPPPLTVLLKSINSDAVDGVSARAALDNMTGEEMKKVYVSDLTPKLTQDIRLQQYKYYKLAGRSVPDVGGFLQIWGELSFLCVVAARMEQLVHNVDYQRLVAGLIFRSVAEIRDDDDMWAYKLAKTEKLDIFDEQSTRARLHGAIIGSIQADQDKFIQVLRDQITSNNIDAAFKHLKGTTTGRLGLSERLIQSLWTGQIVFPSELTKKIQDELLIYNITASFQIPTLEELKTADAFDIITSIGIPKVLTVATQ
jgi:hypothetical protein